MKDKPLFTASVIFLFLYILFIVAVFSPLRGFFSPLIIMGAIIYFLNPLVKKLIRLRIKPAFATLFVYVVACIAAAFILSVALPKITGAIIKVADLLIPVLDSAHLQIKSTELLSFGTDKVYSVAVALFKSGAAFVVGATAAFYFLSDTNVKENTLELIPKKIIPSFKLLGDDLKMCLDSFFKGQILIAAILFAIDCTFLLFVGVENAVGLSAIAALLDIIPYAGAIIGGALIVLATLLTAPEKAVIVLIGLLIIQQIENNVITPKISSDTLKLHPGITVLVLYIGAYGGFWGILLSVPLACMLKKISERFIQSIL